MSEDAGHRSEYSQLLNKLFPLVRQAGTAIMEVHAAGTTASEKSDGSPVTIADENAEKILLAGLAKVAPDIPVVSEENPESHKLSPPDRYFLVDPLDGTREFIKADGKGAFTVNIALIENGQPVLGIVFAPALDRLFAGVVGEGAVESSSKGSPSINVRPVPDCGPTALASVSHRDEETKKWLRQNEIEEIVGIGSSIKFCLLACGEADVYPRFGPTMEWDTAAGDAILRAAGGTVCHMDGRAFSYGKADYKNGAFLASGKFAVPAN